MRVPDEGRSQRLADPVDAGERDAGLDQPPGQQDTLAVDVVSVAVANSRRLQAQVERLFRPVRSQHVHRCWMMYVVRSIGFAPLPAVETAEPPLAISHAAKVHLRREGGLRYGQFVRFVECAAD